MKIDCNNCPIGSNYVEVDTLCETYCEDMSEYCNDLEQEAYTRGYDDGCRARREADFYRDKLKTLIGYWDSCSDCTGNGCSICHIYDYVKELKMILK